MLDTVGDTGILVGSPTPRVGVPTPARSSYREYVDMARSMGIEPMPWQEYLARIAYAIGPGDLWLYPEIAAIVSRQNGKTAFILPHIRTRMAMGRRIVHAAQTRELPRLTFLQLAVMCEAVYLDAKVRRGAGQETIEIPSTGGFYKIVAATGGAPRGLAAIDDLILDELREIGEDFVEAAKPTTLASPNPQFLYLSNAGTEDSTALNRVRARAGVDPSLAYLEWSAAPDRSADDPEGWSEANPALGHRLSLAAIERNYQSAKAAGTLPHFETEHLCRWVTTLRERLVDEFSWVRCHVPDAGPIRAPSIAVSMAPDGKRASVAAAWARHDGTIGLHMLAEVTGDPINTDRLGQDVKAAVSKMGAKLVGFDPWTDKELVKYLDLPALKQRVKPVNGQEFANASAQFVNILSAGRLRWDNADAVTDDLTWTSRKPEGDQGGYHAVRASDERSITAALAAIRAVWLASGPKPGRLRDAVR